MSSETSKYFVRRRGRVMGPFDMRQLRRLEHRGQIDRLDDCSTDRRNWSKLGDLEALYPKVAEESPAEEQVAPELVETVSAGTEWFYHHQGQQLGPVSEGELMTLIVQGGVLQNDSVWCEGMADWQAVKDVFPASGMQPGMMQPGMQPGMMQPGMQPGMMQPGMMQPGMMQPGMAQPGSMVQINLDSQGGTNQETPGPLIVWGYVFAFLFPLVGLIIGIVACCKGYAGHGVAHILLSIFSGSFWYAVAFQRAMLGYGTLELPGVLEPIAAVLC